ncbi:hypothetical protein IFR04_010485 [Cadophora malorum]|uniref:SH3 domain-containing protein n=1 Tax=Cadophora malorum TaxID=108018 RepID=A0A8H7TCM7_9HELO|nr:hypothetical protein IFR04_010485 [Cadophora malorum]
MARGTAPSPPINTVYPLPRGTYPRNDASEMVLKHRGFLCRAFQPFVGDHGLKERDVKMGEQLLIIMGKRDAGWLSVSNHESQGGNGWVPATYLERYDPDNDPLVYYDKRFPADKTPLYIYNPIARPPNDKTTIFRLAELLRPFCAEADFSGYHGLYEIGIKNLKKYGNQHPS